jgi:DNA-binding CsgD family transcriptional regulator
MKTLDLLETRVFTGAQACDDRHVRLMLAGLGTALAAYAIGLAVWEPGALTLPAPVHVAIGWSFVAAGYAAWRLRPENRLGLLMGLTGVVWFGRDFDWFGSTVADHASELSQNVFLALLAHQVVVFPYGVTRARRERFLVAAAYALAVLGYPPSEASDTVNAVLSSLAILLAVGVVYVVVDRWVHAADEERRALAPLVAVGPPVLVVAALTIAHDYLDVSLTRGGETAVRWSALVYIAIPAAFLAGAVRTRLRRALLGRLLTELAGGTTFDDDVLREAAEAARRALRAERPAAELPGLTPRELEVLSLIAEGRTDRGIARDLYVTPKTVEAHVRSIFRKLDLPADSTENRRVHAVLTFLRARTP